MVIRPAIRPFTEPVFTSVTGPKTGGGSAVPANSITTDTITDFVTTDAGDYVLTD